MRQPPRTSLAVVPEIGFDVFHFLRQLQRVLRQHLVFFVVRFHLLALLLDQPEEIAHVLGHVRVAVRIYKIGVGVETALDVGKSVFFCHRVFILLNPAAIIGA